MLRERHRRWPICPNPYLVSSRVTAADAAGRPAITTFFVGPNTAAGASGQCLRRDRILDEARHTGDPVHLMHLFALSVATAIAYTRPPTPNASPSTPPSRRPRDEHGR
ncbi:hypothetical protein ACFC1T_25620 [Kitasatospora sp. NPDC056076]|uniref:hypothetical protein n=1 Tax=Kitasatospora sp. NPDC056076 TaxID=3345703 RepID=UPI0035D9762B